MLSPMVLLLASAKTKQFRLRVKQRATRDTNTMAQLVLQRVSALLILPMSLAVHGAQRPARASKVIQLLHSQDIVVAELDHACNSRP